VMNHNNTVKLYLTDEEEVEQLLANRRTSYGIWALPDATGSIGVVTLNLPRMAFLSKGEWETFTSLIDAELEVARAVLLNWRRRYERSLRMGLMPLTKMYLGSLRNHFNTIGIIGLPEAAANFMRDPTLWIEGSTRSMREAVSIEGRMVSYIRERVSEFEIEDGYLYNVEEVPGESTGYRLASIDSKLFRKEYEEGSLAVAVNGGVPFYSNSIVPYYADVPLPLRVEWEGLVQSEFTGGVMMHLFLEEMPDPHALRSLVRRIVENTRVVYFSITPTMSVCRSCGWSSVGTHWSCPKCGSETQVWSRIVGYYRPVSSWNIGKKAEFKLRVQYKSVA